MATPARGVVHRLLERAHSPDTANQIFTDKIQHREQFLRPTSPGREDREGASTSASASLAAAAAAKDAAELAAAGAQGHNGRDARRRSRRIKQEQRQHRARALKPKPLSSRQRREIEKEQGQATKKKGSIKYATFVPLHQLWLGYIREVLGPNELRTGGAGAAAKLTAADFHGALVEVTRSACVGRVGTKGIVIRDTRFVFEVVTPANEVKMVPKEGTFFRIEIPLEDDKIEEENKETKEKAPNRPDMPKMVIEVLGSQFMHRAIDRANRKFKQHFYKEL
ncbi:RNase P/RNase MRP complex subunit [Sporothrix bragantina]|uniref:Ribonuclease P protein subunit n=1 Tax=Sporothrix bragantina TaxID=671064 RepID=A0ABP0C2R8_9PEZI